MHRSFPGFDPTIIPTPETRRKTTLQPLLRIAPLLTLLRCSFGQQCLPPLLVSLAQDAQRVLLLNLVHLGPVVDARHCAVDVDDDGAQGVHADRGADGDGGLAILGGRFRGGEREGRGCGRLAVAHGADGYAGDGACGGDDLTGRETADGFEHSGVSV